MGIKWESKSLVKGVKAVGLSVLMGWLPYANADADFLCDASQASSSQLPVLDKACPIGKGLWGRAPQNNHDYFWIQCGLLEAPLTPNQAKPLYSHISTNVWMRPASNGYRCLIGPYRDFQQAVVELQRVKQVEGNQDAFLREVLNSSSTIDKRNQPAPREKIAQQQVSLAKEGRPAAAPTAKARVSVPIRAEARIDGVTYQVPFLGDKRYEYYMERNKPWTRLDYTHARQTCQQMGMGLATIREWQRLLASKQLNNGHWPVSLPYWGENKLGLFTSGKVNQLQGNSELNVLCVSTS